MPPQEQASSAQAQDDPGETNDFVSNLGGYDVHAWTTLNQIFERLGRMDQKLDYLAKAQDKLKKSVERHDKLITRAIYWTGGVISLLIGIWFIYDNLLKDHLTYK